MTCKFCPEPDCRYCASQHEAYQQELYEQYLDDQFKEWQAAQAKYEAGKGGD